MFLRVKISKMRSKYSAAKKWILVNLALELNISPINNYHIWLMLIFVRI